MAYGAGLRVSEVVTLKVAHIDSQRIVVADQMENKVSRNIGLDVPQIGRELLIPMLRFALRRQAGAQFARIAFSPGTDCLCLTDGESNSAAEASLVLRSIEYSCARSAGVTFSSVAGRPLACPNTPSINGTPWTALGMQSYMCDDITF